MRSPLSRLRRYRETTFAWLANCPPPAPRRDRSLFLSMRDVAADLRGADGGEPPAVKERRHCVYEGLAELIMPAS
jgi:hypothetical protein